ncbi:MAG: zinc ribbon domain-containing protein, partial [Gammaproteobacteria bacterium]|nr:zinc ribbon domain-containing protein [Gammaproteobacteria bacterium]
MPNEPSSNALPKQSTECKRCKEPIRTDARVCRYCGAQQRHSLWLKFSSIVKWAGGIVTVISLSIGTVTLSSYYLDWREKQEAISELTNAADWLVKTDAYLQAWQVYEKALELTPSSVAIRKKQYQLAKRWLHNFGIEKSLADKTLNRITVVLYRSIDESDPTELATTLAHIGWVQVLRGERFLPLLADVDALFEQARRADPNNVYVNAMTGYWLLQRGITAKTIKVAEAKFVSAEKSGLEHTFVRRLQFSRLASFSYAKSDAVERAAHAALLRASFARMKNGEPLLAERIRYTILDAYGPTGRAEHVEASIRALAPSDHLAVIAWLMEGLDYGVNNARKSAQLQYIKARIGEAAGQKERSLESYRALAQSTDTTKQLDQLVNKSIERLTGKLPAKATARTYINDPIDKDSPWRFHSDTLAHFDPKWLPNNYRQALDYFGKTIAQTPEKVTELATMLANTLKRVKAVLQDGNEIGRFGTYTSGFSASSHAIVRENSVRLLIVYAKTVSAMGKLDEAIAALTDAGLIADKLDDRQIAVRLMVLYE